jgi:DNA-binding CsgD family transcriptional regulator
LISLKPDPRNPAALGELLLRLYGIVVQCPLASFRAEALALIRVHLPFDAAYWALMGEHEVYDSCAIGLPPDCTDLFNRTEGDHSVARELALRPQRAMRFGPGELADTPHGKALAQRIDARHVLTTSEFSVASRLRHMFSLIRRGDSPAFSADEQALLQILTPHLVLLLRLNEFSEIGHTRAQALAGHSALAVVDPRGMLHAVEPQFESWLLQEWPGWQGPALPAALRSAVLEGRKTFDGKHISAVLQPDGGRVLLTLRSRPSDHCLTPRERAVASAYAAGQSHKEVARQLGLSPVTVRGYLRLAYQKLGVNDKAQLAQCLAQPTVVPR